MNTLWEATVALVPKGSSVTQQWLGDTNTDITLNFLS